ncbi:MAG: molecular chaperone HtpG [Alphaproteobacteria bacterium]|nr:molecular chaperone HtpG [Alphaproteobacteria bacterium]
MSAQKKEKTPSQKQQGFGADVSRLLKIVTHALYTNHDVFLRELISNSADACDRLRYDSISNPDLTKDNPDFRICTYKDTTARTLSVVDNGIGMSEDELTDNLGTIAKSGTASLMEQMEHVGDNKGKLKLIGQFGVGFYAGFMVANKIQVVSRKAGEDKAWLWESNGHDGFIVREPSQTETARLDGKRGTAITLWIKDEASEFLLDQKIEMTVKEYSDHISVPIFLGAPELVAQDKDAKPINSTSALWMRSKNEVGKEEYEGFYKNISGGYDEPIMTSHWRAEGAIEFSALLYTPTLRPWDLFDPSRRNFIKLYVRRIFITDNLENLMYPWLRFMRGIIDSEDLPLNISRESLQHNPTIDKIRNAVARHILSDLDKLSRNDPAAYATFWGQFGPALKEGLYDATEHRQGLLKICRFYSTHDEATELTSLADYVDRMKPGQDKIYYLSGESLENIKNSPQLEGFKSRDIEVLFFTDTIDDFWLQSVLDYKDVPFQSITKGDVDFDSLDDDKSEGVNDNKGEDKKDTEKKKEDSKTDSTISALITKMQELLKDNIHNVRISKRLTDSPVCLVAPDNGVDMYMERVLRLHQKYEPNTKPVLEINHDHSLIKKMAELNDKGKDISDATYMLLDQAKIIQGEPIDNPSNFARRISEFMNKAL